MEIHVHGVKNLAPLPRLSSEHPRLFIYGIVFHQNNDYKSTFRTKISNDRQPKWNQKLKIPLSMRVNQYMIPLQPVGIKFTILYQRTDGTDYPFASCYYSVNENESLMFHGDIPLQKVLNETNQGSAKPNDQDKSPFLSFRGKPSLLEVTIQPITGPITPNTYV